jgi:phosphomevalonate kinase
MDCNIFVEMNDINKTIIEILQNIQEDKTYKEKLRYLNDQIRSKIRELSKLTDVQIEPSQLTPILDNISSLSQEILFVIIPGGKFCIYRSRGI